MLEMPLRPVFSVLVGIILFLLPIFGAMTFLFVRHSDSMIWAIISAVVGIVVIVVLLRFLFGIL